MGKRDGSEQQLLRSSVPGSAYNPLQFHTGKEVEASCVTFTKWLESSPVIWCILLQFPLLLDEGKGIEEESPTTRVSVLITGLWAIEIGEGWGLTFPLPVEAVHLY